MRAIMPIFRLLRFLRHSTCRGPVQLRGLCSYENDKALDDDFQDWVNYEKTSSNVVWWPERFGSGLNGCTLKPQYGAIKSLAESLPLCHTVCSLPSRKAKPQNEKLLDSSPKEAQYGCGVPNDGRWDDFLASLLSQSKHSAFAALLSTFERGRLKVVLEESQNGQFAWTDNIKRVEAGQQLEEALFSAYAVLAGISGADEPPSKLLEEELTTNEAENSTQPVGEIHHIPVVNSQMDSDDGGEPSPRTVSPEQLQDSPFANHPLYALDAPSEVDSSKRKQKTPGQTSRELFLSPFESCHLNLERSATPSLESLPPASTLSSSFTSPMVAQAESSVDSAAGPLVHPSGLAFNSPSARYVTLPKLIYNVEVSNVDLGWEKDGGFSRVRRGTCDVGCGRVRTVAVKYVSSHQGMSHENAREALRNEWEILSRVPMHPHIVEAIGANFNPMGSRDEMFLVEEWMPSNLSDVLGDPSIQLTFGQIVEICTDVARGLEHLHHNNITHYDLKPHNILLNRDLTAKIADFGSSKVRFENGVSGSVGAGTMGYTAPEISPYFSSLFLDSEGKSRVPKDKVDVYSLGVVMFECVTGRGSLQLLTGGSSDCGGSSREGRDSGESFLFEGGVVVGEWCPAELRDLIYDCTQFDCWKRPSCLDVLQRLQDIDMSLEWLQQRPELVRKSSR
ncbi:hypothetical protein BSKO_08849 [Bryopsis sp. KO-2023]|nr:hypothetical protein BSKO_08849 [Bryopsis sp. KO-2023]